MNWIKRLKELEKLEAKDEFPIKMYYENLRKEIEREDNITNQRMTWSITAQGFLIAAIAFLFSSPWPIVGSVVSTGSIEHSNIFIPGASVEKIVAARIWLIQSLGFVGLSVSIASFVGIWGARTALNGVRKEWEKLNSHLEIVPYYVPRTYGDGFAFVFGGSLAIVLPFLFICMWIVYLFFMIYRI
jgi:hypothetical protein